MGEGVFLGPFELSALQVPSRISPQSAETPEEMREDRERRMFIGSWNVVYVHKACVLSESYMSRGELVPPSWPRQKHCSIW